MCTQAVAAGFSNKACPQEAETPPIDHGAQNAEDEGPHTVQRGRRFALCSLQQDQHGQLSGWRKTRPGRLQELRDSFLGGAFQQRTFGDVCLLRKTDEDEKWIIDDGLTTTTVMMELREQWATNGGEAPQRRTLARKPCRSV